MNLSSNISVGEFLKPITFRELKSEHNNGAAKLGNTHKVPASLRLTWDVSSFSHKNARARVADQIEEKSYADSRCKNF